MGLDEAKSVHSEMLIANLDNGNLGSLHLKTLLHIK